MLNGTFLNSGILTSNSLLTTNGDIMPISFTIGFLLGILVLIELCCLLYFMLFKSKTYLYYAGYILLGTLYLITDPPYAIISLPSYSGMAVSMIFASISLYFVNQFALAFLNIKKEHFQLYRYITIIRWILISTFCISIILTTTQVWSHIPFLKGWFYVYLSTAWTIQIALVVYQISKGNKDAYIYLLAITPLYLLTSYQVFCWLDIVPYFIFNCNPLLFGFTFEALVLAIAMLYQSYLNQQSKINLELLLKQEKLNAAETQIQVLEDERNRIAEDLHDDLGSNLASLKLQIEGMATNEKTIPEVKAFILKIISESSTRLSEITHNLMPPAFKSTPFPIILENYFHQLKQNPKLFFEFHILNYSPVFSKKLELILYRITLELCQNIIKHSQAKTASIQLVYNDDSLVIVAEDNGVGMSNRHQGIGLESINARVNYMNGKLNIDTNPHGTSITIVIPFKQQDDE